MNELQADADVHFALTEPGSGVVHIKIHEPGNYIIYCSVPGHREAGMEGLLVVTDGDDHDDHEKKHEESEDDHETGQHDAEDHR